MQDRPLLISGLLTFAEQYHPHQQIVSRFADASEHRYGYREVGSRARRLASALRNAGVRPGDRIATLAMNHFMHLELYFAVSGVGAVLHTVNPRLYEAQLIHVLNDGGARLLFLDRAFIPMVDPMVSSLPNIERYVIMGGSDTAGGATGSIPDATDYEAFVASEQELSEWPTFDERAASLLCYTSGTTGLPKGVLYSHRSTVLHALSGCQPASHNISAESVMLAIPPMFHAAGWGFPYFAAMAGAKLVLPGPRLDGESIHGLIEREGCTWTVGVPTVFAMLLEYLRRSGKRIDTLRGVGIGGAAAPQAMIDELGAYGCSVRHAWGMTETSPLGTMGSLTAKVAAMPGHERDAVLAKQGRVRWGLELDIRSDQGETLPHDGATQGSIWVRGPWVAKGYYGSEGEVTDTDGWFPTGDVGTLDQSGFLRITDRTKDIIKSGGEWISSLELENYASSVPGVRQATAIAVPHAKWGERPLLLIVREQGVALTPETIVSYLTERVAKWWLPDEVVFVDELPVTATGKIDKLDLRQRFHGHFGA